MEEIKNMDVKEFIMEDIKHMDVKEFREKGYLQELNRLFLHPLGLAMEVVIESDGSEELGGIWDYREDPEGIYYGLKDSDQARKDRFKAKKEFIAEEQQRRALDRSDALGFVIEPIE